MYEFYLHRSIGSLMYHKIVGKFVGWNTKQTDDRLTTSYDYSGNLCCHYNIPVKTDSCIYFCNFHHEIILMYRVGQKNRPPTLLCLYYCSISLGAQITYPVNWNSVVHILKPKLNLYVRSSFEIIQQSQSIPNIIMSQW